MITPDTYAVSHDFNIEYSQMPQLRAQQMKTSKFAPLPTTHNFFPVAVETSGAMWAYVMSLCILFVSNTSSIVLNPSAGAMTDYSKSAKGHRHVY